MLLAAYVNNCLFAPVGALCSHTVHVEGVSDRFCEPYTAAYSSAVLKNCVVNGRKTNAELHVIFPSSFSCGYGDTVKADVYIFSDRADSLAENDFTVSLSGKAYGTPEIISEGKHTFLYFAKLAQNRLASWIATEMPDTDAAVVKALLLGDKSSMTDEFRTALSISGASHIFAVSGMHLSLWSGVIFLILRKRSRTKILPNIAAGLFVLFYMALTGFSPSVMRSGIMLLTVFAGYCFRRPADPVNSLGLSAVLLLIGDPLTSLDVSFLLSFNATAAILLLYPYLERRAENARGKKRFGIRRLLLSARNTIVLSLCVLLFTVPVSGEYFGSVSLLSPVSSLICTLPAEAVMIVSALALVCYPLRTVSSALFFFCSRLTGLITFCVTSLSKLDFAVFSADMRFIYIWYLLTAAAAFLVWRFGGRNTAKTLTALLLCAAAVIPYVILTDITDADSVYLRLEAEDKSFTTLIYTDAGRESFLIYNCEDENAVPSMSMFMDRHVITDADLLIVPTVKAATADAVGSLKNDIKINDTAGLSGSENFTCELSEGIVYRNYYRECPGAGILTCGDIKTVFRFYAGAAAENVPQEICEGDILICRSAIPEDILPENFKHIIVVSGKTERMRALPENALLTADTGGVTVKYDCKEGNYAIDR